MDVLGKNHDDKECKKVMEETIPLIQSNANKKRAEDTRYPGRVGREVDDAIPRFKREMDRFDKAFKELHLEEPKNKLERIKNDKETRDKAYNIQKALQIFL